jgi:hypothetical protein
VTKRERPLPRFFSIMVIILSWYDNDSGSIPGKSSKMDIKKLQEEVNSRWKDQKANPCHGSDTNHALIHMTKAIGKIASALNDAEHEHRNLQPNEIDKYLADLVICAVRFADDVVDLDAACTSRLSEKFPVAK